MFPFEASELQVITPIDRPQYPNRYQCPDQRGITGQAQLL